MKHICAVHGLNSTSRSFNYINEKLKRSDTSFTMVDYDSHQPLAKSIAQVIDQFPKKVPLTLIGHSLGGVIAALIASEEVHRVERLITISSPFNGSKVAATLSWIPGSFQIFNDISPRSQFITKCCALQLKIPTLSIISITGHLPTFQEANDSVVTLSSQRALKFGTKIEINASHFEVLMSPEVIRILEEFIWTSE